MKKLFFTSEKLVCFCFGLLAFVTVVNAQEMQNNFWVPYGPVYDTAISDSVLYVGGEFQYVGPPVGGAAIIDLQSGLMSQTIPYINGFVSGVVSDGNGGFYIGGQFLSVGGVHRDNLVHIMQDGSVNENWNIGTNGLVYSIGVYENMVFVSGLFSRVGTRERNGFAVIDSRSGNVLDRFSGIDRSGRFKIYGSSIYMYNSFHVKSYNLINEEMNWESSTNINSYDISVNEDYVFLPSSDGMYFVNRNNGEFVSFVVLSGNKECVSVYKKSVFVCNNNDVYEVDVESRSFNKLVSTNGLVLKIAIHQDILYMGGHFNLINGIERIGMGAFDLLNGAVASWNPIVYGYPNYMNIENNNLVVGGSLKSVNGIPRSNLAAINIKNGLLLDWSVSVNGRVEHLESNKNELFIAGRFSRVNEAARSRTASFDVRTGELTDFSLSPNGLVLAMKLYGSQLYLGGAFTAIGGQTRNRLVAFDINSREISTWNPNVNGLVRAIEPSENFVYIGGGFSSIGGVSRMRFAEIDSGTGIPSSIRPSFDGNVLAIKKHNNIVYVGGEFRNVDGQNVGNVVAIDVDQGNLLNINLSSIYEEYRSVSVNSVYATGNVLIVSFGIGSSSNYQAVLFEMSEGGVDSDRGFVVSSGVNAINGDGNLLFFSNNKGIEVLKYESMTTFYDKEESTGDLIIIYTYPNPSNENVSFSFDLGVTQQISLVIYDVLGREVARVLENEFLQNGRSEIRFATSSLNSGIYIYRLVGQGVSQSGVFSVVR